MYRPCASCGLPVYPDDRVVGGEHLSCAEGRVAGSIADADAREAAARHFSYDHVSWGRSMIHRRHHEDGGRTLCGLAVGADAATPTGTALIGNERCPRCEGVRLTR